jgi:MinD superfamily P-loop ATPase
MNSNKKIKTMTIISGKGGTGKTSIAASFAVLAAPVVVADCDVDAANLHLVLSPEVKEPNDFYAMPIAKIKDDDCTSCGICKDLCRYDAITMSEDDPPKFTIDPLGCEACLVCKEFCPEDAIETVEQLAGEWYVSGARTGPVVHAHLGIAQDNSGKLVTTVRKAATEQARKNGIGLVIVDGPPGIGCAVIASLTGSDLVLAVTEATLSGLSDLLRVYDLTVHFKIPLQVLINKADLNLQVAKDIKSWAKENGVKVVGELPYDPIVTKAMIAKKAIVEYEEFGISSQIKELWKKLWVEI